MFVRWYFYDPTLAKEAAITALDEREATILGTPTGTSSPSIITETTENKSVEQSDLVLPNAIYCISLVDD